MPEAEKNDVTYLKVVYFNVIICFIAFFQTFLCVLFYNNNTIGIYNVLLRCQLLYVLYIKKEKTWLLIVILAIEKKREMW